MTIYYAKLMDSNLLERWKNQMTEDELRQCLLVLKEKAVLDMPKENLASKMLQHIGSTDPMLRDKLIHTTFNEWISETDSLDFSYLKNTLNLLQGSDFLFKGIKQVQSDHGCLHLSVQKETESLDDNLACVPIVKSNNWSFTDKIFTRSFSVLLITQILHADNRNHFLSFEEFTQVKDSLMRYIDLEDDLRGFVIGKGWAHSLAHISDAFDEVLQSNHVKESDFPVIFKILTNKVYNYNTFFHDDEEERVLVPIFTMLEKGYAKRELVDHVMGVPAFLEEKYELLEEYNYWILYANTKLFLRSLYFKTKKHRKYTSIHRSSERILDILSYQ